MRNDRWKPFDIGKIPEINTKINAVYVPQGNITQENVLYDVECMRCGHLWTSSHKRILQKITLERDTCKKCKSDIRRFKYLNPGPLKNTGLTVIKFENKLKVVANTTYEVEYSCCKRRVIIKHRSLMLLAEKTGPAICRVCTQKKIKNRNGIAKAKKYKSYGVQWDPPPSALDPDYPRWK